MSHLTTFTNDTLTNCNRDLLEKSLAEIGVTLDYNTHHVRNSYIEANVDAALVVNGRVIAAGLNFIEKDGKETIEVSGDFFGTGLNQEEFTNRIAQVYKKNDIVNKCRSQRWYVNDSDVRENEDGDIVITASRFV